MTVHSSNSGNPQPFDPREVLNLVSRVFTPASPISDADLFAGRKSQILQIIDAINQPGQHAILYGERGVGKTSLANILNRHIVSEGGAPVIAPRVNCDVQDDFSSVWRKVFAEITIPQTTAKIGFADGHRLEIKKVVDSLPAVLTPDHVKSTLQILSRGTPLYVVIDEFDRLAKVATRALFADAVKALSDHSVDATVVLVGVADSVDDLIHQHQSIERALVQIPMPRMSRPEVQEIIQKGVSHLGMAIDANALEQMSVLSNGLPHYTHLLGLHIAREALNHGERKISVEHVEPGIATALSQVQQSIRSAYNRAVASPQKANLYAEVLLACALAEPDEMGWFPAAAVRAPMSRIMGKAYDIPSFSRHLKDFCEPDRGKVLCKMGPERGVRFRFTNPLMQPFITMQGWVKNPATRSAIEGRQEAKPTIG